MKSMAPWTTFGAFCLVAFVVLASGVAAAERQVSDRTGILTRKEIPAEGVTESQVFLSLPHIRQEPNLCVPTSAAMVLSFHGDSQPPRKLKVLSRGKVYDPQTPFDDFTITWWRDLIRGIKPLGYEWFERGFANTPGGFERGLAAIRSSLQNRDPVLVDVALYRSHTFVIVGYDDDLEMIYANDPNIPRPGVRALTFRQLESIWNGLSYDVDLRPALFTGPKKER